MPSSWKHKVAKSFDRHARDYESHADLQRHVAEKLTENLPDLEAPDVLEIGCGTGFLTQKLVEKYKNGSFRISDISPAMVDVSAGVSTAKNIEYIVMDGEAPLADRTYELIVSSMTMQWFEDLAGSLARLKKLLKPGGKIFYSMPGPESFKEWSAVLNHQNLSSGLLDFFSPDSVIEEEHAVIDYQDTLHFLKSMKAMGAHTARPNYHPRTPAQLRAACERCDALHQGRITWHILYGMIEAG